MFDKDQESIPDTETKVIVLGTEHLVFKRDEGDILYFDISVLRVQRCIQLPKVKGIFEQIAKNTIFGIGVCLAIQRLQHSFSHLF